MLAGTVKGEILVYNQFQYDYNLQGSSSMITGLYLSDIKGEFYST